MYVLILPVQPKTGFGSAPLGRLGDQGQGVVIYTKGKQ